jgi:hypothetical protein
MIQWQITSSLSSRSTALTAIQDDNKRQKRPKRRVASDSVVFGAPQMSQNGAMHPACMYSSHSDILTLMSSTAISFQDDNNFEVREECLDGESEQHANDGQKGGQSDERREANSSSSKRPD